MEQKTLYLTLIAIIALLAGFAYSFMNPTPVGLEETPFSVITAGFFLAGTIFFGYLGFIPMLLFGLQAGAEKNAAIVLYIIPSILSTYAGTKLGLLLHADFNKKQNFLEHGKKILLVFVIALVLAVAIEQTLPYIMEYWPKDFLGMNVEKGKTVFGLIGDLSALIRH